MEIATVPKDFMAGRKDGRAVYLNASQATAVATMMSSEFRDGILAIQGPPETGAFFLIAECRNTHPTKSHSFYFLFFSFQAKPQPSFR